MPTLLSLPEEVLGAIFEYIEDCHALALTCKAFLSAARCQLFKTITFAFDEDHPTKPKVNAAVWRERLEQVDSLQHVRTIRIVDEEAASFSYYDNFECGDRVAARWWTVSRNTGFCEDGSKDMVALLNLLQGLTDLICANLTQLSQNILEALEQRRPQCRLHVQSFKLLSLYCRPPGSVQVDPFHRILATSASLHSVALGGFDEYDSSGFCDFHLDALRDMVRGAAPNLRKVSVLRERPGSSLYLMQAKREKRPKWRGTELGLVEKSVKGRLQSLELAGYKPTSKAELQKWSEVTDFGELRELNLHTVVDSEAVRWMTNSCDLRGVRSLVIHLGISWDGTEGQEQATAFFQTIGALARLKLCGQVGEDLLSSIGKKHGATLRYLAISPFMSWAKNGQNLADTIRLGFPLVEELAMPLPRTNGDVREVAAYRSIGRLPRLQRLYLVLQCSEPVENGDYSLEGLKASIRYTLANHAVDEALARAIFDLISSENLTCKTRFQQLEMRMESRQLEGTAGGGLNHACRALAGRWTCRRSPRDNQSAEVEVKGSPVWQREVELSPIVAGVFRGLWSDAAKVKWTEAWHSFPLATKAK